ncbi:hypothetical protein CCACVL1_17082 [Corchorus capsularis]|uniref:Uncharacterized protein n=1 Tax=Corchorus capsularis TaxID=210143 RepID=A0A1R3HUI6_COCAP|nr:hypothetical protein CCACVL1_17082 [Corchorus capsularis]
MEPVACYALDFLRCIMAFCILCAQTDSPAAPPRYVQSDATLGDKTMECDQYAPPLVTPVELLVSLLLLILSWPKLKRSIEDQIF